MGRPRAALAWPLLGCAVVLAMATAACRRPRREPSAETRASAAPPAVDRLAPLHAFEEQRRREVDFARLPPSDRSLGPDPIAIRALPGASPARYVGLLRARDALVLLDRDLHEIARATTPALPTGLAVADDGAIAVSGEQSPEVALYTIAGDAIRAGDRKVLDPKSHGLRDVALGRARGAREVYAVDERRGLLLAWREGHARTEIIPAGAGPFRVVRAGGSVLVDSLLDHRLRVFDVDADGRPSSTPRAEIHHDGPIWSFDARATPDGLLVAAGGVEDHPLDRTEGSFGFIDSFVFLYRVRGDAVERLAAIDVGELGVVTPKAIVLRAETDRTTVFAAGYGSDRLAEIAWSRGLDAPPSVTTRVIVPGVASMAAAGDALVFADTLFDAWGSSPAAEGSAARLAPALDSTGPARSELSRVGEALFFTNLMAPWNHAEGRLSRFTCEACHFEGYVDGRTHNTGRGDVRATTKPLLGLFNNRPHFSRALDPDLAVMVDNEFRAAGAKSDHDPWFSAKGTGLAWIDRLGAEARGLDALGLRRALMSFLMDFTHRPNTAVLGRSAFSAVERHGAEVFARRCERCHEARLSADDPTTRKAPALWEALVMTREGPIVWASDGYRKTGVTPYVHDLGARPPSLRRLYKKWPYFTNGSAKSLAGLVADARFRGDDFWHASAPADATGLGEEEREAIEAFLDLL